MQFSEHLTGTVAHPSTNFVAQPDTTGFSVNTWTRALAGDLRDELCSVCSAHNGIELNLPRVVSPSFFASLGFRPAVHMALMRHQDKDRLDLLDIDDQPSKDDVLDVTTLAAWPYAFARPEKTITEHPNGKLTHDMVYPACSIRGWPSKTWHWNSEPRYTTLSKPIWRKKIYRLRDGQVLEQRLLVPGWTPENANQT